MVDRSCYFKQVLSIGSIVIQVKMLNTLKSLIISDGKIGLEIKSLKKNKNKKE